MGIKGVIFDLDGVIVSTDEYHYQSWQRLADEEGICFDRKINERLRGVSRMESLEIVLEKSDRVYSQDEKLNLAERKNNYFRELLKKLTHDDILPGVENILGELKRRSIKIAIGSSSKNSPTILERIGLGTCFDATSDGNDIENSKPDPEVFIIAAERLSLLPEECLVVEDASAGVEAAIAGGMRVLAVGSAKDDKRAHISAADMDSITVDEMLGV